MVSLEKFKLSLVSWDSDKDPGGYPKWVKQWSSVVRSTKWGSQLESFLDRKLKRKFSTKSIIPSFLTEDEDLQDAPEAQPQSVSCVYDDGGSFGKTLSRF